MQWTKRLVRTHEPDGDVTMVCDVLSWKGRPTLRSPGIEAHRASPEDLAEARSHPELCEADLAGIVNVRR